MIEEFMLFKMLGTAFAFWKVIVRNDCPMMNTHEMLFLTSRIHFLIIDSQIRSELAHFFILAIEFKLKSIHTIMNFFVSMVILSFTLVTSDSCAWTIFRMADL